MRGKGDNQRFPELPMPFISGTLESRYTFKPNEQPQPKTQDRSTALNNCPLKSYMISMRIKAHAKLICIMADLAKNLARKLKRLRGEQTQRVFAKRLGITQPHLNRIEQGKENITLKTIQKLCNRLRCKAAWLLDGDLDANKR